MNTELDRLANTLSIGSPAQRNLALRFGHACGQRVEHLLEEPGVIACLQTLNQYLAGTTSEEEFAQAASTAVQLANRHRGSKSIDGCGHAAVSATYAVANALAGKALEAASYAAYASVYASGGYAAVADREAFEPEFAFQVACLRELAREHATTAGA